MTVGGGDSQLYSRVDYVLGDGTSCLHRVVVTLELTSSKLGRLDRSREELLEDTEESDFSFAVDGIYPYCSGLLIGDEVESAVLVNRMGMERSLVSTAIFSSGW